MFELGSSLREARVRRRVELDRVSAETRIRMRYLTALEEERFELLPGSAYAKGFLRTYADYLGLDGQVFVDEYNARFTAEEAQPAPPQLDLRPRSLWRYGLAAIVLFLALGGALLGWQLSGSSPQPARPAVPSAATTRAPAAPTPRAAVGPPKAVGLRAGAPLVLSATRGPCWLSVRRRSELGRLLFESTLQQGESRRFRQRQLWMRIGAPWNLQASRGGRRLSLPQTVATVLVTAGRIRTVGLG
jgi:Helix-turn-helix domain/RodZ C-terminal domain